MAYPFYLDIGFVNSDSDVLDKTDSSYVEFRCYVAACQADRDDEHGPEEGWTGKLWHKPLLRRTFDVEVMPFDVSTNTAWDETDYDTLLALTEMRGIWMLYCNLPRYLTNYNSMAAGPIFTPDAPLRVVMVKRQSSLQKKSSTRDFNFQLKAVDAGTR